EDDRFSRRGWFSRKEQRRLRARERGAFRRKARGGDRAPRAGTSRSRHARRISPSILCRGDRAACDERSRIFGGPSFWMEDRFRFFVVRSVAEKSERRRL